MGYILVVDDDTALRDYVEQTLREQGYDVRTAADGNDALAQIAAESPALVLLDLGLPSVTGWGVLRELRARHSMTPVICMTAAHAAPIEAQRQGASGYLGKPFSRDDLLDSVARLVQPLRA
jgi:DNA-binding response OmpR family regulator